MGALQLSLGVLVASCQVLAFSKRKIEDTHLLLGFTVNDKVHFSHLRGYKPCNFLFLSLSLQTIILSWDEDEVNLRTPMPNGCGVHTHHGNFHCYLLGGVHEHHGLFRACAWNSRKSYTSKKPLDSAGHSSISKDQSLAFVDKHRRHLVYREYQFPVKVPTGHFHIWNTHISILSVAYHINLYHRGGGF